MASANCAEFLCTHVVYCTTDAATPKAVDKPTRGTIEAARDAETTQTEATWKQKVELPGR